MAMNSPKKEVVGCLCIATVVAFGIWHANDPERIGRQLSFLGAGQANAPAPETRVSQVYWSADGRELLSAARGKHSAKRLLSWHSFEEKNCRMPIDAGDAPITSAALAPDGRHVLVATADYRLAWIDLETSEFVMLDKLTAAACFSATAVAPDGQLRAAGTDTGAICLFDSTHYNCTVLASPTRSAVSHLSVSRERTHLVCAQNNGSIGLWSLASGRLLRQFEGHRGRVTAAFLVPGGKRIISAGLDDTIRIWDVADGSEVWHGEFDLFGVSALALSADGTKAAWGGRKTNSKIFLWDLERGMKSFEIDTTASAISHLAFSPDGLSLAAAENDELIHLYDAATGIEQEGIRIDDSNLIVGVAM
jgi:WD40 repeat protein